MAVWSLVMTLCWLFACGVRMGDADFTKHFMIGLLAWSALIYLGCRVACDMPPRKCRRTEVELAAHRRVYLDQNKDLNDKLDEIAQLVDQYHAA